MNMRVVIILLLCICAVGKPFPEPIPERVFPCTGLQDVSICGNNGECKFVIQNNIQTKQYVCDDTHGALNIDNEPCTRARTSCTRARTSKALAFWLQLFFGYFLVAQLVLLFFPRVAATVINVSHEYLELHYQHIFASENMSLATN